MFSLTKNFWKNQRVLITGGHGFLGSHLVALLRTLSPKELRIPSSQDLDFRHPDDCQQAVAGVDTVIHLAANVGGIGYNQKFPATLFYDNVLMGAHLLEAARQAKVRKFVGIGTICAYPKFTPVPFSEDDLWNGYPEETNAPYGLAKKMLLVHGQAARQQYGLNFIYLLPTNLYGPGDNFDPASSHVIPALVRKFLAAKTENAKQVTVWGTGRPTREFLYVADAAQGIALATQHYNGDLPVNLGTSQSISIRELAETIAEAVGYTGNIVFDSTKPDGQPQRQVDASRAKKLFGFTADTTFRRGLRQTISAYRREYAQQMS